ncbi:MAG TPA: hypothetical protein VH394_13465 [Thermoanaerobaculia bacterium]|nr:hypothetical protein [Thermoanaerobaculia bacterium]
MEEADVGAEPHPQHLQEDRRQQTPGQGVAQADRRVGHQPVEGRQPHDGRGHGEEVEEEGLFEDPPERRALAQGEQAGEGHADQHRPPEQEKEEGEQPHPHGPAPRDVPDAVDRLLDRGEAEERSGQEDPEAEAVQGLGLVEELAHLLHESLFGVGKDLDEDLQRALRILVEDPGADEGEGGQQRDERDDRDEGQGRREEEHRVLVRLVQRERDIPRELQRKGRAGLFHAVTRGRYRPSSAAPDGASRSRRPSRK